MTTDPSSVTAFDPDSGEDQACGALEALIERIDGEVSELHSPRFTKDDSLNLGLLLVGLRARLRGGRIEDQDWYDESVYAAHGGCFPVYVTGVGAVAMVTVSGLPQQEDHDLVVETLREILASMRLG